MPLGTEVDLGPGHIVLDEVPALRERGTATPPIFSAHVYCGYGRPSQLLLSCCLVNCREVLFPGLKAQIQDSFESRFGPLLYGPLWEKCDVIDKTGTK